MTFRVPKARIIHDWNCDQPGPCSYEDRAYYPATAEQIRKIAGAKWVSVRVIGSKMSVEREFNEANFDRFRDFVERNVPPDS